MIWDTAILMRVDDVNNRPSPAELQQNGLAVSGKKVIPTTPPAARAPTGYIPEASKTEPNLSYSSTGSKVVTTANRMGSKFQIVVPAEPVSTPLTRIIDAKA